MGDSLTNYRSRIGGFCGGRGSLITVLIENYNIINNIRCNDGILFISLCLKLCTISILLQRGNIEINPGPNTVNSSQQSDKYMAKFDELFQHITGIQDTVTSSTDEIKTQLISVESKILSIDDKLSNVGSDLSTANKNISILENKIDFLECKNRENNILFFGICEALKVDDENISDIIINLCAVKLNVVISLNEINKCHRLGAFKLNKNRPVLLSLVHNRIKTQIFSNAKNLKGSGISISDDLTPNARAIKKLIYDCYVQAQKHGIQNLKRGKAFLSINGKKVSIPELQQADWILGYVKNPIIDNSQSSSTASTKPPKITLQGNGSTPPTPSKVAGGMATRLSNKQNANQ
jgi:hypothetical protein